MAGPLAKAQKRAALLWDLARRTPWRKGRRLRDRSSQVVVWIHHRAPESWLRYLLREDTILKDAALVDALCRRDIPFRIVTGRGIEDVRDATVLYTVHAYNPDGLANQAAGLLDAVQRAESRGNTMLPSAAEAEWWENKVFMHRLFAELGIRCPATTILGPGEPIDPEAFTYPVLAKEPHSQGSAGLHKVNTPAELVALRERLVAAGEPELLIQELIDMSRDLRATCVGNEVVHHYFRINTTGEWQPTSTRRGSLVDFETFPEQWRDRIIETLQKCGLRTGAFDICWEGDDLESEPIFLEVSPSYTPNPPPPSTWGDRPYADFKGQLTGPDRFSKAFVDVVFDITDRVVDLYDL